MNTKRTIIVSHLLVMLGFLSTGFTSEISTKLLSWAEVQMPTAKVVWVRTTGSGIGGFNADFVKDQMLMGYDTDNDAEFVINDSITNYRKPMITYDGRQVIWSNLDDKTVRRCDWDGSNEEILADGVAGCLYYDETANKEYLIYAKSNNFAPQCASGKCSIYKMDLESLNEEFFFNGPSTFPYLMVNGHWLSISSDGKILGGAWPFGDPCKGYDVTDASVSATTPSNSVPYVTNAAGCWPTMPYDNRYLMCVFNDTHDSLKVYDPAHMNGTAIKNFIVTGKCNTPRFSSYDPRLLCVAGGQSDQSNKPGNVTIFKVNQELTAIVDTVYLSDQEKDGFVDCWIGTQATAIAPRSLNQSSPVISEESQHIQTYLINGSRITTTDAVNQKGIRIERYKTADGAIQIRKNISVQ